MLHFGFFRAERFSGLSKPRQILILAGGALFNLLLALLVWGLIAVDVIGKGPVLGFFFGWSVWLLLSSLAPVTYPDGKNSDGKQILQVLRTGRSTYDTRQEERGL